MFSVAYYKICPIIIDLEFKYHLLYLLGYDDDILLTESNKMNIISPG